MRFPNPVLLLCGALCVWAGPVLSQTSSSTFSVNISLSRPASTPSSCATLAGPVAIVTCLSNNTPAFSAPGRPDVLPGNFNGNSSRFETAASVPSVVGVTGLGAAAGGAVGEGDAAAQGAEGASGEGTAGDGRTLRGASFETPPGSKPPDEIEVSF